MRTDEAMKAKVLPPIADLEIETEAVSTWSIDDWRALKQKERGPIFQCGGHPWYVGTIRETFRAENCLGGVRLNMQQADFALPLRQQCRLCLILS